MIVGDQSETIEFLKSALGNHRADVEVVVTHASLIFLAGDSAFKLKRAVRYPYLDFSTPEKRLACCQAELALNRRTAPTLYLGVQTITRSSNGHLAFDGADPLVDAVVEMRRFGQDQLLDAMAQTEALTPRITTALARQIAKFHASAHVSLDRGGTEGIARVLDINDRALRATSLVTSASADAFAAAFRQALNEHSDLLERRRKAGKVRRCHGDLILRNICLIDGLPTLFDCLEFNDDLATIDVLYDLGFLLMDLWHRDQCELANLLFNRYIDEADETDGMALIPFFMAIRAAVRAHVTAAQAIEATSCATPQLLREARAYFNLASSLLCRKDPFLVAIGGLSGTGKSTVSAFIAPHVGPAPGARILNSDRIRKRLYGVPAEERLPGSAYLADVSEAVYQTLRKEAGDVLSTGYAVVADAVFDRPAERRAIEVAAIDAGVAFRGVWLDASGSALLARVATRRHDISDATTDVVSAQLQRDCGEISWLRINAEGDLADIRRAILASLGAIS
jgi:aminoglycoside phosphotransferase family enzyme/predicted kinase